MKNIVLFDVIVHVFYEGCSNMNANSFITFRTYILRQNVIRFYEGLYIIFKLAPDLKKSTIYVSSYSLLNEDYPNILTTQRFEHLTVISREFNS